MTEGSIAKNIILFYIPLAIGGLFQQLYSFVDSVVVGRGIGAQALAAVGATSIVVWLTLGFAMGITKGFCIHISQAYGKKDYHLVNRGFFVASVLSLIVGTMISIVGSLAIRDFLILMHTPGEILEQSLDYIKVILLGFVITVLNNLFMSVLQSLGDSSTPFCALLVSSITNVGLDCIFELARRIALGQRKKLPAFPDPGTAADYCRPIFEEDGGMLERTILLLLDGKGCLIREKLLSIGTIDAALVSPREIFLQALRVGAVSFLLLHNHPSGDVTPSPEDKELTKRLAMLGGMMQLCLTDHIIVGDSDFFSFRQAGLI